MQRYPYMYRLILLITIASLSSCYSFRGTSIPPDMKSYYVAQCTMEPSAKTAIAPGEMPVQFMEALRAKIRNQSRLIYNDVSPDIEFRSTITQFETNENVGGGNNVANLIKLTSSIKVEYINLNDEEDTWTQVFSHTINYEPTVNLQTAQDGFIEEILEQISEQAFNKAFTNW